MSSVLSSLPPQRRGAGKEERGGGGVEKEERTDDISDYMKGKEFENCSALSSRSSSSLAPYALMYQPRIFHPLQLPTGVTTIL